jgi:hypothetical protein
MITKFGKRFLTDFIAGNSDFNSKDIALGISSTAATENDTRLGFEFYRLPVSLTSIDIKEVSSVFKYYAIYKATIPQDISGVITEIGLYPGVRKSTNFFDSKFVTSFENNSIWFDSVGGNPQLKVNTTSPEFTAKIGESMVQFDVATSSAKEYTNSIVTLDLSGYSVNDSLSIAYKKVDNNVSNIRVKLYSSDTQYYYADFTPASGSGDRIQSVPMSTVFGNTSLTPPDATSITKVGIEVTAGAGGSTAVYFDGLRINDEDTFDPQYGLIARHVLTTPLQKPSGRPVDIEYKLELEF